MKRAQEKYLHSDLSIQEMVDYINNSNHDVSQHFINEKITSFIYESDNFEGAGLPEGMTRLTIDILNEYGAIKINT